MIEDLGAALALRPRTRFPCGAVLIVDGTLVPTCDHEVAAPSRNYRYSTNHQVVIDADIELVVALGRPLPGNRNDCRAWTESGAAQACRNVVVIADGGYHPGLAEQPLVGAPDGDFGHRQGSAHVLCSPAHLRLELSPRSYRLLFQPVQER